MLPAKFIETAATDDEARFRQLMLEPEFRVYSEAGDFLTHLVSVGSVNCTAALLERDLSHLDETEVDRISKAVGASHNPIFAQVFRNAGLLLNEEAFTMALGLGRADMMLALVNSNHPIPFLVPAPDLDFQVFRATYVANRSGVFVADLDQFDHSIEQIRMAGWIELSKWYRDHPSTYLEGGSEHIARLRSITQPGSEDERLLCAFHAVTTEDDNLIRKVLAGAASHDDIPTDVLISFKSTPQWAQRLLDSGLSPTYTNSKGQRPYEAIPEVSAHATAELYLASCPAPGCRPIYTAYETVIVLSGIQQALSIVAEQPWIATETSATGRTALMCATGGKPAMVHTLLNNGANPLSRDNTGRTALHYLVLDAIADATPLPFAEAIAVMLIRAGADLNARDNDGHAVLDLLYELRDVQMPRVALHLRELIERKVRADRIRIGLDTPSVTSDKPRRPDVL